MRVVVFVGPTLPVAEARSHLDAVYAPPAGQGDLYRAAMTKPFAIGLIDGYFEHVPAVWHKEILWALANGVHVFGASSMGALRAAETARYGMRGIGSIFEDYASGRLEDDDEVAVAHESKDNGYRVTSEALVNLRATLRAAEQAQLLSPSMHAHLLAKAKSLFYPERSYAALLHEAKLEGLDESRRNALAEFVKVSRVDQKRLDAISMLKQIARSASAREPRPEVRYLFSHTAAWQDVETWATQHPWDDSTERGA